MKKLIAFPLTWIFWALGHLISCPVFWWGWSWLYRPYNWLMLRSQDLQRWGGCRGPWRLP